MSEAAAAEIDRTVDVVPPIRHAVPWRVLNVDVIDATSLRVRFVDGTEGSVDMGAFLRSERVDDTVFAALRNPAIFREARCVLGAVQWPNGAELAPDAMYDAIQAAGVWNPD